MITGTHIASGLLVGAALGLFYFGTLWATVRRLPGARRPLRLLAAGFVLRLAVVLSVLVLFTRFDPGRLLGCLAAFFAVRIVMTACLGRQGGAGPAGAAPKPPPAPESRTT
jgi:F1F0 ATPase subunit 2